MKKLLIAILLALTTIACNACGPEPEPEVELMPWEEIGWTCSNQEGEHPCDFTLKDQYDTDVSLYDFYGQPVILDLSAMWCGPCSAASTEVEEVVTERAGDNLAYIVVLIDDTNGQPPTIDDCSSWADFHGITTQPVLAGSRDLISSDPDEGWPLSGWPTFAFIDDEMNVYYIQKGFSADTINAILDMMLNSEEEI